MSGWLFISCYNSQNTEGKVVGRYNLSAGRISHKEGGGSLITPRHLAAGDLHGR